MLQGCESLLRVASVVRRVTPQAAMRALWLFGTSLVLATAPSFPAHGFSSAPYFPLVDGNQWTYQKNGGVSYTDQVLSTLIVNGNPTKAYYDSEDGTTTYYSNDANGIRQHRIYIPPTFITGCGTSSETDDFSPPIVIATPDVTVGQVINSSGNLPVSLPGCSFTDLFTYQASSTIVGIETVTVPFGMFSTLRVQLNASIYYQGVFQFSLSETHWVAPNVGAVQSTYTEDGITDTYKLTATNVVRTTPDAFSFTAQSGVTPGSLATSNTITVAGTTVSSPISVTGGQYSINGGAFTSTAGSVSNGQSVAVRQTASTNANTTTNATLTIGGVSATFSATTVTVASYALTVQVTGAGAVTSSPVGIDCGATCTASYVAGTPVTLTATVTAAGNIFSGWSGGGCSGTGTCTVTMDATKTVNATFIPNTLTINKVGSGTVTWSQTAPVATFVCGATCSRNIREGDTVTLTAAADPSYSFTGWSGGGCSGTGSCVVVMNSPTTITATFTFIDTQAPSVPAGLTATAVGGSQINLAWSAATDNVGVTLYRVFQGGAFRATVNAPATSFADTGLTALTAYSYTVAACDAAGNCSAQSASVSATTLAAGQYAFNPQLELGFNLIGNALNVTLDVAVIFGNQDAQVVGVTPNIVSIWKWNAVTGRWAFYSPQLTIAGNTSYAASKNYEVLATINTGEGYWVNALLPMALPTQSGTGFNWNGFNFAALPSGFNLIAQANSMTPSLFNSTVSASPPAPGVVPTDNFVSLWTWDAVTATWYFYSPLLEASGGLAAVKNYADSHFFRHFQDYGKTIGIGVGFWVNRP